MKRALIELASVVAALPPHFVMVAAVLALTTWGRI
jgi:hypothetical protein